MEAASNSPTKKNRPIEKNKQPHLPTEETWHEWRQEWALAVNRHKFGKGDKHAKAVGMVLAFLAWSKSEEGRKVGTYTFGNEELALLAGIAGKDAKASRDAGSAGLGKLTAAGFARVISRGSSSRGMNSTVQLVFPEAERSWKAVRKADDSVGNMDGESDHPEEVRADLDGEFNHPMDGESNHPMDGEFNHPDDGESNHPSPGKSWHESENKSEHKSSDVDETVTAVDAEGSSENDFQEEEPISTEDWEAVADFDSLPKTPHLATAGATFAPDRQKPLDPDDETPPW